MAKKTITLRQYLIPPKDEAKTYGTQRRASKECFTTAAQELKTCGAIDISVKPVRMPVEVSVQIDALMDKYPGDEWLAYLIGQEKPDGFYITKLHIPPQEVNGSAVEVEEGIACPPSTIGTIHSHNRMSAFFSGTDDSFVCKNHPVTIVVGTGSTKWACKVKTTLPCNHFISTETPLAIMYSVKADIDSIIEQADANISKKTYTNYSKVVTTTSLLKCVMCRVSYPLAQVNWVHGSWVCSPCKASMSTMPDAEKKAAIEQMAADMKEEDKKKDAKEKAEKETKKEGFCTTKHHYAKLAEQALKETDVADLEACPNCGCFVDPEMFDGEGKDRMCIYCLSPAEYFMI